MKELKPGDLVKFMWKVSVEQKGRIIKQSKSGLFLVKHEYSGDILRLPKSVLTLSN